MTAIVLVALFCKNDVVNPIKLVMTLQQQYLHHILLGSTTLDPLLQRALKNPKGFVSSNGFNFIFFK
jgi:hypothetical protein